MMELPVATNSLAGTGPHLVKSVAPAGKGADDVVAKVVVAAKAVVAAEAVMAVEAVMASAKVVLAAGNSVVAELCIVGPQPNPSYSQHHIALLSDQTASQVATNATQSYCFGAGDGWTDGVHPRPLSAQQCLFLVSDQSVIQVRRSAKQSYVGGAVVPDGGAVVPGPQPNPRVAQHHDRCS